MPAKKDRSNSNTPSEISKMLVKDLKEELNKRNLSTSGLKADLVARLEQAMKEEKEKESEKVREEVESKVDAVSTEQKSSSSDQEVPKQSDPVPAEEKTATAANPEAKTEAAQEKMEVEEKKEENKRKSEDVNAGSSTPTEATPGKRRKWGASSNSTNDQVAVSTETINTILAESLDSKKKEAAAAPSNITVAVAPEARIIRVNKTGSSDTIKPAPAPVVEEQQRIVPPAKYAQTNILLIRNFVRPFTQANVEQLLKQTGSVKHWGMDGIKSRCVVMYETEEEAVATREALHNLIWPPHNNSKLHVDFATEEEARNFFRVNRIPLPKQGQDTKPKKVEPTPEPPKSLDELFRKTTAKPPIYYLPLSDEEVAKKNQATTSTTTSQDNSNNKDNNSSSNTDSK